MSLVSDSDFLYHIISNIFFTYDHLKKKYILSVLLKKYALDNNLILTLYIAIIIGNNISVFRNKWASYSYKKETLIIELSLQVFQLITQIRFHVNESK